MRKFNGLVLVVMSVVLLVSPFAALACGGGTPIVYPTTPRMAIGMQGSVSFTASGDPLRVRQDPGLVGNYLTQLYNGAKFTVVDGPQTVDSYVWWKITTDDNKVSGWVAEGANDEYYIEPLAAK